MDRFFQKLCQQFSAAAPSVLALSRFRNRSLPILKPKILIFFFTILFSSIANANSVFLPGLKGNESCFKPTGFSFRFQEKDFTQIAYKNIVETMRLASVESGTQRRTSIECLKKKFTELELERGLDRYFSLQKRILEYEEKFYRDKIQSLSFTKEEIDLTKEFLELKRYHYELLEKKTREYSFQNFESTVKEVDQEFGTLYLSLLKNQYEFLLGVDEDTRKQLLSLLYPKGN